MDLHPGRNVYPTSWFILFVLLLTGIAMCVIPTHVRDLLLHGPPPCFECLPDQLLYSVCVVFDRW